MKKLLLILLVILPIYLASNLYFLDKEYFLCPIEYKADIVIRSDSRGDGFFASPRNGQRLHEGIDLFASVGTAVLAVRFGKVVAATKNNGLGNYVMIRHSGDMITIYGHLDQIYVKKGDFVKQGSIIASVGKTGNARYSGIQPHLHFEVRKNDIPQDPLEYF